MRKPFIISLLAAVITFTALTISRIDSLAQSKSGHTYSITDGTGVDRILIDQSTESDVRAEYGEKFTVNKHNEYSFEMQYPGLGLAFYYCQKDAAKKIFIIEAKLGSTNRGIVVGKSTLAELIAAYGEPDNTDPDDEGSMILEYQGVQFYVEGPADPRKERAEAKTSTRKVIEADVMSPHKTSNFCDEYE